MDNILSFFYYFLEGGGGWNRQYNSFLQSEANLRNIFISYWLHNLFVEGVFTLPLSPCLFFCMGRFTLYNPGTKLNGTQIIWIKDAKTEEALLLYPSQHSPQPPHFTQRRRDWEQVKQGPLSWWTRKRFNLLFVFDWQDSCVLPLVVRLRPTDEREVVWSTFSAS